MKRLIKCSETFEKRGQGWFLRPREVGKPPRLPSAFGGFAINIDDAATPSLLQMMQRRGTAFNILLL